MGLVCSKNLSLVKGGMDKGGTKKCKTDMDIIETPEWKLPERNISYVANYSQKSNKKN